MLLAEHNRENNGCNKREGKDMGEMGGSGRLARFLAFLPAQRSGERVLAEGLEAALEVLPADAGMALYWGEPPLEVKQGEWPPECLPWLEELSRRLQGGLAEPVAHFRSPLGHHCVGIPLSHNGTAWGLLAVVLLRQGFSLPQEELLLVLAEGMGTALGNLAEMGQARRRLEQLGLLYEIGRAMNSTLDVRKLLDEMMRMGKDTMGAEACSVLLVDEARQELFFEIAKGEAGKALEQVRMKMDQGIAGWIATHGQPLIINDVSKDPRFYGQMDQRVKFATRSIIGVPLLARGKTIGVIEVLNKREGREFTAEDLDLLTAISADAAISIDNARLYQAVLDGYLDTIKALAASVDAKDPYTAGHIDRVSNYSLETASVLGLSEGEMEALRYGSILHDVGKIGIEDSILRKPSALTREEWGVMCTHTDIGSRIVEGIRFLERARPIIRHHHENFDGSGYPDGLAGEAIPVGARIVGTVDAFDAMTTDRPYRKALSTDFAIGELRKKAGTQFDPRVVEAFARGLQERGLLAPS